MLKSKSLYLLLSFLLALVAGCASVANNLEGKWVVDKKWIDTLPTPQNYDEAMEIYGVPMNMVEMVAAFLPKFYYEFVPDGPLIKGLVSEGEEQVTETYTSWQVEGDWIIITDGASLEFHWLEDGKLQLITNPSGASAGKVTFVRAEEN